MKKEQLKKLTRNYFIQQKLFEVLLVLIIIPLLILIPYQVGLQVTGDQKCTWYPNNMSDSKQTSSDLENCQGQIEDKYTILIWVEGFYICFMLFMGIVLLGFLIRLVRLGFKGWIKLNWKKAEIRARREP